jgi:ribosomal protein L12E/L44/L45/RPP1/RPP2
VLGAQGISVADHLNERAADYRLAVSIAEETGTPLSFLLNMGAKAAPAPAPAPGVDDDKEDDDAAEDPEDEEEDDMPPARRTRQ